MLAITTAVEGRPTAQARDATWVVRVQLYTTGTYQHDLVVLSAMNSALEYVCQFIALLSWLKCVSKRQCHNTGKEISPCKCL
jgi:hypothetical protein